jgi:hypothetical protein
LVPAPRGPGADHNSACFIVKDASGLAVAYVYSEEEPGRRTAADLMTKDEARRIAAKHRQAAGAAAATQNMGKPILKRPCAKQKFNSSTPSITGGTLADMSGVRRLYLAPVA